PPILLNQYISGELGGIKDRMLTLIYCRGEIRVSIIPACFGLYERDFVGRVAIHFIGTQMDEWGLGTKYSAPPPASSTCHRHSRQNPRMHETLPDRDWAARREQSRPA